MPALLTRLAASLGLLLATPAAAELCGPGAPLAVEVAEQFSTAVIQHPSLSRTEYRDWLFTPARGVDLLGKQRIVAGDPHSGHFWLSDGSSLLFDRDCRGTRCLYSGVQRIEPSVLCPARDYSSRAANGEPRIAGGRLTVEQRGEGSRLLLVAVGEDQAFRPLVLADLPSPVVGLALGVALHGTWSTLEIFQRERSGRLVLSSLIFDQSKIVWADPK